MSISCSGARTLAPVRVSIIIVNWNGGELLRRCIASIVASAPQVSCEIIVIDNASTDESVRWLQSEQARSLTGAIPLRVMENGENTGFSRATNQGIGQSDAGFEENGSSADSGITIAVVPCRCCSVRRCWRAVWPWNASAAWTNGFICMRKTMSGVCA